MRFGRVPGLLALCALAAPARADDAETLPIDGYSAGTVHVGTLLLDLTATASVTDWQRRNNDLLPDGSHEMVSHLITTENQLTRLTAELGVVKDLALGVVVPSRVYHTDVEYLGPGGAPVQIVNAGLSNRTETLTGPGDPWLYARAAAPLGAFVLGGRVGITVPLGRVEPNPYVLQAMQVPHELSQFGTGTVGLLAGADLSWRVRRAYVRAAAFTIQTTYANDYGYKAGDHYQAMIVATSRLGSARWVYAYEATAFALTPDKWSGVIHTGDGPLARVELSTGATASYRVTASWNVGATLRVPLFEYFSSGGAGPIVYLGLSVTTSTGAFGAPVAGPVPRVNPFARAAHQWPQHPRIADAARALDPDARRIEIAISDAGFEAPELEAALGESLTLAFTRTSETTWIDEIVVVYPDGSVRRQPIAFGQTVELPFVATRPGRLVFGSPLNVNEGGLVVPE